MRSRLPTSCHLCCCCIAAALIVVLTGTGCARTVVTGELGTDPANRGLPPEMAFLTELPARPAISNDDGFRGLLLTAGERDPGSYAGRVERLQDLGWLEASWEEPADLAMQRGTLSRLALQLAGMRGGLMLQLLGPTGRYAQRELVFRGIMAPSSELQTISGSEFLGFLGRLEDEVSRRQRRDNG